MLRDGFRYREVSSEFWQPAFARLTIFAVLLLAAILSIRVLAGLSSHNWAHYFTAGPILDDVENTAMILCVAGILAGCLKGVRGERDLLGPYRQVDYGRAIQFAGMTLGILAAILYARPLVFDVLDRSATAKALVAVLDVAGGLLVPLAAVITLAIFPAVFLKPVCSAVAAVALGCLFCTVTLKVNRPTPATPRSPATTTQPMLSRPAAHQPMFC